MSKVASIVLPTYNEKENIESTLREIFKQEVQNPGWKFEVVIADSNSPDGTFELAEKLAKKDKRIHPIKVSRGLGVGIIEGHNFSLAKLFPDAMLQMDADGQVDPKVIGELLSAIDDGYTLAIGSRFVSGGVNKLSFRRRLFSSGAGWYCRIVMGPFAVKEFTNSARAFTPQLFKNINLDAIPWRDQSFISQPAFLHQAIKSGAKYKEVPLTFKDRAEGYSKNKTLNYMYDIITYCLDVRLNEWGVRLPIYKFTHKAKTPIKFGLVGVTGTLIDFIFYNLFISGFGIAPATSKGLSTEIAILNNFVLNNTWTFRNRKTKTNIWQRLAIFNLVSFGGLMLGVLVVKFLHDLYGDGYADIFGIKMAYYNLYFFATIPPVMVWNFTINHFVTWRNEKTDVI